jgi:hypothetical protein
LIADDGDDRQTSPQPDQLFSTKGEARLYLVGLFGFWAGFGGASMLWLISAPSTLVIAAFVVLAAGWLVAGKATRRLEEHLTGRSVRPWPFGFPRLRTQLEATLPSTVVAAAKRLDMNPPAVAIAVYGLLALDMVAFVATWYARR